MNGKAAENTLSNPAGAAVQKFLKNRGYCEQGAMLRMQDHDSRTERGLQRKRQPTTRWLLVALRQCIAAIIPVTMCVSCATQSLWESTNARERLFIPSTQIINNHPLKPRARHCPHASKPFLSEPRRVLLTGRIAGALLLPLVLMGGTGCQTFNLTQEEWEKQQRGEMVDPTVGAAVCVFGTLGTYGVIAHQLAK